MSGKYYIQGCIQKMGLGSKLFSNCRGQRCNRESMALNKLRGSVDMFSKEILKF